MRLKRTTPPIAIGGVELRLNFQQPPGGAVPNIAMWHCVFSIEASPAQEESRAMSMGTQRYSENGHAKANRRLHLDIRRVAEDALRHADDLVRAWLPKGRLEGREWVVLNPTRTDTKPGSFKINLLTGEWADFATGDSGLDLVSLKAYLDGLSQLEAAFLVETEIGTVPVARPGKASRASAKKAANPSPAAGEKGGPVIPAPREANLSEMRHSKRGLPSGVWPYYAADGALHHMKARYDQPDGGKAFCYWRWTGAKWDYGAPATPFPLYNIADLIERIDAPVLVVEGEKTADAASKLFPGYAVVTSGGDNSASDADWTVFAGRRVVIWPDQDKAGARFAESVAGLAAESRAEIVALVAVPDSWPAKWDLADAPPDGVTVEDLTAMLDTAELRWPIPAFGGAVREAVETLPLMRDPVLPQPYPMDDLGPFLAPVARAIARQVKVPEAMAGSCVLSIAALAAQGLADVELPVGGGLRSPLSLYFMAVAKSGARKSTAEKKANRGAAEWQKAAMKSYRVELRAYKTAVKDHEAGRKSAGKNGDGFHVPEPVEPVSPRLLVSDATAESVVKLLGGNNRPSIGLFTGEGGKFTSGYAMSDKAKGYSAAVFNTLDEAHRYAPNQAPVASTEPLVNLATAGRKRGFGALFATQRLSQLSKDILGQCPNRIMGRVDQALDRRAAAEILGFAPSSKEAQGLMRLSHEFWMVGPALAPEPVLHRFSEALTTHLQPGNRDVPSPPTPEKLRAILGRLSAATELPPVGKGKGKAARMAGQGAAPALTNAWATNAVAKEIDAARATAHRDGFAAGDAAGYARGMEEGRRRGIADAMAASEEAMSELLEGTDREPETNAPKEPVSNSVPSIEPGKSIVEAPADRPFGSTHQKVLDALAWCHAAGIAEPGRQQVGWAAGYRADTGHFGNILTDLANKGLIDRARPGQLALTASGRALTAPRKGRFTPSILVERIKAKISGPAAKVLDCLVEAYPAALPREELGAKTGYRADTGHFGNLITELASPEIVTRPRPGEVRLSDWVMLK